jgi:hypothetical protein
VISEAWYPHRDHYWVAAPGDAQRPFRYGDLFAAPTHSASGQPLTTASGQLWHAVMVLSPSCEVISKAGDDAAIEVARVMPLAAQDPQAAAAIVAGWQEKGGRTTVAFAHTVFLAGVAHTPSHAGGMFANLKETVRIRMTDLRAGGRLGALDHDARVAIIRRELYYRYRWLVTMEDVRELEADRIGNDPYFTEPRPWWGQPG